MPKFTGLSLSFCIGDIMRGLVAESDVEFLVAGTKAPNDEVWQYVVEHYKKVYWNKWPEEAAALANRLRDSNMIRQPRAEGATCHNISAGWWLTEKGTQCRPEQLHDLQKQEEMAWMFEQGEELLGEK